MSRPYSLKPLAFAVSCALPLLAQPALAQQGSTGLVLEEVVVTAQKREESLQDAPIAMSAFTAETLEAIGAHNITDVGDYTPNVTLMPTLGSSNNIRMEIRGMATAEPSLLVDPKVGIYLDGAYVARNSGAIFDVVDIERVEVMRGPQGTLWGKNTTGGAVNIVTRKPAGELAFKQQLSVGNDGYLRSISALDTPEAGGFSARLSYMRQESDGWAENHFPGAESDLASQDVDAYRVAARWDASETLTFDYSYDRTDSENVAPPLQMVAIGPGATDPTLLGTFDQALNAFYPTNVLTQMAEIAEYDDRVEDFYLDNHNSEDTEIDGHNLTTTWDVGGVQLKSISAWRSYDTSATTDADGGAWTGVDLFTGQEHDIPVFSSWGTREQDQFSQELQAIGMLFDGQLDYVLGLYYFEEDGEELNPWDTTLYVPGQSPVLLRGITQGNWYTFDSESQAAFGQFTWRPNDAWYAILGLRYTEDEKEATILAEDPRHDENFTSDEDWNKFTTSITVGYEPSDEMNLYAKRAEGYNAGVYVVGAVGDPEVFDQPADEEDVTSYEIGLKSMLFDRRVRLNAAAFFNDAENLQVTAFVAGVRTVINSGGSETIGLEVDVTALLSEHLSFDAAYGYRETDFDEETDNISNIDGKHSGYVALNYTTSVGDLFELSARFDVTYTDSMGTGIDETDDRTLYNARLTASDIQVGPGALRIALWGRNLADEEYKLHAQDFGMDTGFGFTGSTFGPPLSYGVDFIYEL